MIVRLLPLILVLLAVSVGSALARVGDTWEQCVALYGKPVRQKTGPDASSKIGDFLSSGITYTVYFFENRADAIMITRPDVRDDIERLELTEAEILKHLQDNGGPRQWKTNNDPLLPELRAWDTADSSMFATYMNSALFISTEAHRERSRAAKKAERPN